MTLAVTPDQRSAPKGAPSVSRVTAIAWVSSPTGATPGNEWRRCLDVLKRLDGVGQVVVGGGANAQATLSSLVDEALADGADQLLVAVGPFDAAPSLITRARGWLEADPRFGAACFLSNDAGYLSLRVAGGVRDVAGVNRALRTTVPAAGPVPIATAEGVVFLLGRSALIAAGGLDPAYDDDPYLSVIEFALRASRRGFHTVLDSDSFVARPSEPSISLLSDERRRARLHVDYAFFPGLHDSQASSPSGPLGEALSLASAKVNGLHVAVDASAILGRDARARHRVIALLKALARHPGVGWLGVLAGPEMSDVDYLLSDKVERVELDLESVRRRDIDILYIPSVSASTAPWLSWRSAARRTVVAIDETIGAAGSDATRADVIVAGHDDIVASLARSRAPFPLDRLVVAPEAFGEDHPATAQLPTAIGERNWAADRLVVCVARNFDSPAIDAARRLVDDLAVHGRSLRLVVIGEYASRPRPREEVVRPDSRPVNNLLLLPELSFEERDWLFQHADLVLVAPNSSPSAEIASAKLVLTLGDNLSTKRVLTLLDDPVARLAEARQRPKAPPCSVSGERLYSIYMDALGRPPRRI